MAVNLRTGIRTAPGLISDLRSEKLKFFEAKSLIKCEGVGKHAKWIFTKWYLDAFSTRCQRDFFPRPHHVPKNHFKNIAKIVLLEIISDAYAFLLAYLTQII